MCHPFSRCNCVSTQILLISLQTYVRGFKGAAWVFSLNDSPDCAGWSSVGPFGFPGTATVFRRKPSGRPDRRPASGRPCDALPDRFHWPHDLCRHGPLPHHHCHHLHPDPDHHCLRHRLRRLQGEKEAKVVRLHCYCIWIKISPRIIIILQEEEDISTRLISLRYMFEAQSVIIKHSNNTQPIYQFITSYPIYQSTPEKVRKQIIWTFIAAFVLGRSLVQLAFVVCYFSPCCSSMIWMKPNLTFYCIVYIITFWGVYADLFSSTHPSHKDTWICLLIRCMAKWGPNEFR